MNENPANSSTTLSLSVIRAVVWNQLLWTAGYSLTTGGFLLYFAYDFGATPFQIALILVIPETVSSIGLFSRRFINLFQSRKKTWMILSILARIVSLGIPCSALIFQQGDKEGLYQIFLPALIFSSMLNSVAYMAYLSWLSDLAPETKWGEFFAKRNIAKLSILLILPALAGFGRDWLRNQYPPAESLWIYITVFFIGTILQFSSLFPMISLNDVLRGDIRRSGQNRKYKGHLLQTFRNRSLRYLILHNWWLAFFNGLTQSVFFTFLFTHLKIGLAMFYFLTGHYAAIQNSCQFHDRRVV